METRLDGLLALLGSKEATEAAATEFNPAHAATSSTILEDVGPDSADVLLPPLLIDPYSPKSLSPFHSFHFPMLDDINDIISKGVVHFGHVETCVQHFQAEACSFPFVIVSEEWSIDFLRRRRPVLLLTIMCMATRSDLKLQRQLELEIRNTLSKKVMFNYEKSLDIIQGILVYVAC